LNHGAVARQQSFDPDHIWIDLCSVSIACLALRVVHEMLEVSLGIIVSYQSSRTGLPGHAAQTHAAMTGAMPQWQTINPSSLDEHFFFQTAL
jgi:hypothetical protein